MLNQLIQLDQQCFHFINDGLSNPVFDILMPVVRNRFTWLPLYLFLVFIWTKNYGKTAIWIVLFLLLCFGISDYTASSIIKPAVARLRPCNDTTLVVNSRVHCGSGYSFPSAHAANHFALALFFITVFYKRWKPVLPWALIWAASIGFAQIYVGVHFPIDILAGSVLGALIGYLLGVLFLRFKPEELWNSGK